MKKISRNEYILMDEIVEMSKADNFQQAKLEWILIRIYKEPGGVCLCGHSPITNHCVLKNKLNGNETIVGSSCVQKFIGIQTEKLFSSYLLIVKNIKSYLSRDFADYAFEHKIVNEWEYGFLKSTEGKSFDWLTERQQAKRMQINNNIIKYMEKGTTNDTKN